MRVRRTLLTAGLVVVAVVTGMWAHARAQTQQRPPAYATIAFYINRGKCVKQIRANEGDKVRAKRGSLVRWNVSNTCDASVVVSIKDFTYGGKVLSPFQKEPNSCTAAPGATCAIEAVVLETPPKYGTYKYSVYDGNSKKDPDLIIDP